ncbi:hypothetical protein GDO81_027892 [Engystomops pustulosus]|uniref:Uncharacterized protein n=1 Tax=Engystomops pustulosus TaxID=76066 RepID=A0AAV6YLT1_ENGPU|nr:hypothetical protein GDO81_027892 [Engystomops pustulosus]
MGLTNPLPWAGESSRLLITDILCAAVDPAPCCFYIISPLYFLAESDQSHPGQEEPLDLTPPPPSCDCTGSTLIFLVDIYYFLWCFFF